MKGAFALGLGLSTLAIVFAAACDLLTAIGGGAGLRCRSDEACPRGMLCLEGVCVFSDGDAALDASAGDGVARDRPVADAAQSDAAHADAAQGDSAQADAAHADLQSTDAAHPDLLSPDAARPDTSRPDLWLPDTAGSDRGPCAMDPCSTGFSCVVVGSSYECRCSGVVCSDTCFPTGECCGTGTCGSGAWQCNAHQCACPPPNLDCSGDCRSGTIYYRDADGDGHGMPSETIVACSRPAGYATPSGDCDDEDSRAHPGQTQYYDTAAVGGGYDFDCDDDETPQTTATSSCVSCTPNIRATQDPSRECHRCSDTYSYCWVDYDVDPGPTCTDCCSANSVYQLDCYCPVRAAAHVNCQIDYCIGWLVSTGWAGSVPACGASNGWLEYGILDDTCVANGMNCGDLASTSTRKQKCR